MEHALHGPVAYAIMPLFALANAGVSLGGSEMRDALANPVTLGVVLGLLVGKPLGITGFSWLAVRFGIAALPDGVTWRTLAGAGVLGGIGFTMALFIASLAFGEAALLEAAKFGVLAASALAGVAGWLLLRRPPAVAAPQTGGPTFSKNGDIIRGRQPSSSRSLSMTRSAQVWTRSAISTVPSSVFASID
jgi:NhaA family Na+:H+ antiporter